MCTNVSDKPASIISSDDGGSRFVWTTTIHIYHTKKYYNQNIAGSSRHTAYQNTFLLPQNFTIQHRLSELIGTKEIQLIKLFE